MQHFGNKTHLNTRVTTQDQTSKDVTTLGEQQMIALCKKGDRAAQKALFDSLSPKMFAICIRYMGSREAAEDVLQEGFISLFSKLDSYSGEGSFEGWARKVFVNTALMTLRRNDVMRQSEDIESARSISGNDVSALQSISYKELMGMIAELPPGFRTVFNLFLIEGYSHKEISGMLGISEATSRSQLQRARVMLQNRIKKYK
jgi:RNA polymerase sigma-70 factor (ECF subfamily)